MKTFHCDSCGNMVFFENVACTHCGSKLAYLPDIRSMGAIQAAKDGSWKRIGARTKRARYRLCANYEAENICNWAVPENDSNPLCASCRLTRTIPDLSQAGHRLGRYKLETAKRRLICGLMTLDLPIEGRTESPANGLAFDFLSDGAPGGTAPVLTGHNEGLITINVAEADDAERERRRVAMHEPYRTVLGHFRHEIGHYYWDRLVSEGSYLEPFRHLFGDETVDYGAALAAHYERGQTPDWNQNFVSEYASCHPWEDWAETWAHYLHIIDTLETAGECGLSIKPKKKSDFAFKSVPVESILTASSFDAVIDRWFPLAISLNKLNQGLGMQDPYPFVLTPAVISKLGFVNQVVASCR